MTTCWRCHNAYPVTNVHHCPTFYVVGSQDRCHGFARLTGALPTHEAAGGRPVLLADNTYRSPSLSTGYHWTVRA